MNEDLRSDLIRRSELDQEVRHAYLDERPERGWSENDESRLMRRWKEIDADNAAWIRAVIDDHGWPGKSLVGEDGAFAAWLLVQHASAEFQERCLPLMEQAVQDGEADKRECAYLLDRVLVSRGEPQVFGTQFTRTEGKLVPYPIRDLESVDERRAEIGLESLADNARRLQK